MHHFLISVLILVIGVYCVLRVIRDYRLTRRINRFALGLTVIILLVILYHLWCCIPLCCTRCC